MVGSIETYMHQHSVARFWERYRVTNAWAPSEPPVAEHFCDNQTDADACAHLVLVGIKQATASALASYEEDGEPVPTSGKLTIVTNWVGEPKALIRTHTVTICRFGDIPPEFATLEGEGDGTLAWRRETHRAFWERSLPMHIIDDDLLVVCEKFELVATA